MFNHPSNQRSVHLKQDTVTFSTYKPAKNSKITVSGTNEGTFPYSGARKENPHSFLEHNLALSNKSPEMVPSL